MLALVSAALTPQAQEALARERSWRLRHVPLVADAVRGMSQAARGAVRALVIEAEPVGAALLSELDGLELIACLRSDPVNVDVAAATARGVAVVHTPGRNAEAVADFTLGLCLAVVRNIAVGHHGIVSGELTADAPARGLLVAAGDKIWRPENPDAPIPYVRYKGRELASLSLGVIGFGATGRAVARRFAGLVREILVTDPAVPAGEISGSGCVPASLAELLATADVVTIHARSSAQIIGRAELARMKQGSYLINTARATVLDYRALTDALAAGHLRAAALDVFPQEPLPTASWLRTHPGLTLTPHLAGASQEVAHRQSEIILDAIRGVYADDSDWSRLPVRNPELAGAWRHGRPGRQSPGSAARTPAGDPAPRATTGDRP